MIYTCEGCGQYLDVARINEALKNGGGVITCSYCGALNHIRADYKHSLDEGFAFLASGDFFHAKERFSLITEDKKNERGFAIEAHLGYALAHFGVQTVYKSDDPNREGYPTLTCYRCNPDFIVDNGDFIAARESIEDLRLSDREKMAKRLNWYADEVDSIKEEYDRIAAEKAKLSKKFRYGCLIAYEDQTAGNAIAEGFRFAVKVGNSLNGVGNIFIPDREEVQYNNDPHKYEADILYAIHHCNCMVVIADNNIDARLARMYSVFLQHQGDDQGRLVFIRYLDKNAITLPNGKLAEHVFDFDDPQPYRRYIAALNNVDLAEHSVEPKKPGRPVEPEEPDKPIKTPDIFKHIDGNMYAFGSYPQKQVTDKDVIKYFESFQRPKKGDANGWTVMLVGSNGKPYCWYRDETVGGEKYRAVYFVNYREVYSVGASGLLPEAQANSKYSAYTVYCFKFSPIEWVKVEGKGGIFGLAAAQALDSREFNDVALDGEWDTSTLRDWLNTDFLETAFGEKERELLMRNAQNDTIGDDLVYLLDRNDLKEYCGSGRSVCGSDYMRCTGGLCLNRAIKSFWVNGRGRADEAPVVSPTNPGSISLQRADNSTVGVVPKIKVNLIGR